MTDETERAAMARASGMREADVQRYIQTRRRNRIFADIAAECGRQGEPPFYESVTNYHLRHQQFPRLSLIEDAARIVDRIEALDRKVAT